MTTIRSAKTAIRYLLLSEPNLSVADIQTRLDNLGLSATSFLVSATRRSFLEHLKLLKQVGLLRNRLPEIPEDVSDELASAETDTPLDDPQEDDHPKRFRPKKRQPRRKLKSSTRYVNE